MADDLIPPTPPVPPVDSLNGSAGDGSPLLYIEDELADSYLTYAMSVIVSRALPDVRDGLKPSHRRILVAMNDLGLGPTTSTSKCAAIVGETMKRYHPHGDASIYDSLVRMAQDWVLRYRLVHGQGNFGSIAGLPAAAHRYTEARLTHIAADMLADLDKDTVDYIASYDGKHSEPLVLPAKFPNLLVNGSDGIAVGMATEIPPHNLREICDGLLALLDNPDLSLGELLQKVTGPDFPTGGIIMGRQGIIDGYRSGRGKVTLRARTEIVEGKTGKPDQIIIKEVPFQVTRNRLSEQIAELVKDERVGGISEMKDESAPRLGEPVRLVITLKRGADAHLVLNQLFQFSNLQKTVSIILLALVEGRPRVLSLKEMMQEFIKHRIQVIRRRTEYLLREAKRRGHVLEGQLIAISSLDEVIQICRSSPDRSEAKTRLMAMEVSAAVLERALGEEAFGALQRELGVATIYSMTEQQAEAVVRLQLGQLAALERDEIFKEFSHLRELITGYEILLSDDQNVFNVIREDLIQMRDRYGDDRRTEISNEGGSVDMEDLIPVEDQVVSISHNGYIKRMPMDTYRVQHRGGKGVSAGAKEDDFIEHFFVASTHAYLLCLTNRGQLYWLRVFNIPEASRISAGRSIANVLSLKPEEKIASVIPVRTFDEGYYLFKATRKGTMKKTPLTDYKRPKQGGIIGINLEDDDALVSVVLTTAGDEVVLSTKEGMAIRFDERDARPMGRNTKGVKGISLSKEDELVGMVVADPEGYLMTICENGYGKRTPFGPNTPQPSGPEELPDDGTPVEQDAAPVEPVVEEAPAVEEIPGVETNGEAGEISSSKRYRKQRRGGKGLTDIKTSERNGSVVGVLAVRDSDEVMVITVQGMVSRAKVSEITAVAQYGGVRIMNLNEGDKIVSLAKVAQEEVVEGTTASGEEIAPPTEPTPE